jgi:hypothetical protein
MAKRAQRSTSKRLAKAAEPTAPPAAGADPTEQYETGEVTIRFDGPPDESLLARLGEKHGLEVLRRNEFNPAQLVAVPRDSGTKSTAAVCDELRQEPEVVDAWANTVSRYHRA